MNASRALPCLAIALSCWYSQTAFRAYAQPAKTLEEQIRREDADREREAIRQMDERNRLMNLQYSLNVVVMLAGNLAGAEVLGAGIVVGWAPEQLYIVTANHLVRRGKATAGNLRVTFERHKGDAPRLEKNATLLPSFDPQLDLAVLAVPDLSRKQYNVCSELNVPLGTENRQAVLPVGNPNGLGWITPSIPDAVVKLEYPRIYFQSQVLSRGHSGGGLLDTSGRLLGMIVEDSPPFGVAINIYRILRRLHEWHIPEQTSSDDCNLKQDYAVVKESEAAAAAGDAAAMNRIGWSYMNGNGTAKDFDLASEWLEKAAAAGNAAAMNNLGSLYSREYKSDKAQEWYEKAVAAGSAAAMTNLGALYEKSEKYELARQWYERAAAAGRAVAMRRLGALYENGRGAPKNLELALQWYEKASAAGDAGAADRLKALQK